MVHQCAWSAHIGPSSRRCGFESHVDCCGETSRWPPRQEPGVPGRLPRVRICVRSSTRRAKLAWLVYRCVMIHPHVGGTRRSGSGLQNCISGFDSRHQLQSDRAHLAVSKPRLRCHSDYCRRGFSAFWTAASETSVAVSGEQLHTPSPARSPAFRLRLPCLTNMSVYGSPREYGRRSQSQWPPLRARAP